MYVNLPQPGCVDGENSADKFSSGKYDVPEQLCRNEFEVG